MCVRVCVFFFLWFGLATNVKYFNTIGCLDVICSFKVKQLFRV